MENDFRKINLGKADAQEEGVEFPDLLRRGYYDLNNVVEQVCETSKYLILGYKGSGKSALSEHLKLTSPSGTRVVQQSLKDFPYKIFSKIVAGESENEYKFKVAWRWLLLVQLLSELLNDTEAKPRDRRKLDRLSEFMTQSGIFPLVSLSALVTKTKSKTFHVSIKSFNYSQTTNSENAQVSFEWLIDYVRDVITSYVVKNKFIIIIDGLDDILTTREVQYLSIAALINEVKDLNLFFRKKSMPFKIVVLCRTDIFERLPDANKNKIRRDCSFNFTWYKEGEDTQTNCGLIDVLNIRGQMVYAEVQDVISAFFPMKYHRMDTHTALLEMTRHTPRDFMQLLVSIQSHCKGPNVSEQDIDEGIKEYSSEYFLPEIKDEMTGYIPYSSIDPVINILGSFREREFTYSKFISALESINLTDSLSADLILNVLYDCSAIGHTYPYKDGKETRVTFKYRNRNSSFNKENRIILHKGLWKALNVNY